jgi:hypothetical protein
VVFYASSAVDTSANSYFLYSYRPAIETLLTPRCQQQVGTMAFLFTAPKMASMHYLNLPPNFNRVDLHALA